MPYSQRYSAVYATVCGTVCATVCGTVYGAVRGAVLCTVQYSQPVLDRVITGRRYTTHPYTALHHTIAHYGALHHTTTHYIILHSSTALKSVEREILLPVRNTAAATALPATGPNWTMGRCDDGAQM